jgi:hypothetical protein
MNSVIGSTDSGMSRPTMLKLPLMLLRLRAGS